MLRASSLGLKCYRHTWYFSTLQCRKPAQVYSDVTVEYPSFRPREGIHAQVPGRVLADDGICRCDVAEKSSSDVPLGAKDVPASPPSQESPISEIPPLRQKPNRNMRRVPSMVKVIPPSPVASSIDLPKGLDIYEKFYRSLDALPRLQRKVAGPRKDYVTPPATSLRRPPHPPPNTNTVVSKDLSTVVDPSDHRSNLLKIMANTGSVSLALEAYHVIMSRPRDGDRLPIPWEHLHRLARLITSTKPRTRSLFIDLVSVVSTIHKTGGRVQIWQWNALIDFAGKGWRKTRQEDFKNAFHVFNDMVAKRPPGATFSRNEPDELAFQPEHQENDARIPPPDAYTYTTLLNIAARTNHEPTLRLVQNLLASSDVPPTRTMFMTLLQFYSRRGELAKIRHILAQMKHYQFELSAEGVNSCLWSYARLQRFDVASALYCILHGRRTRATDRAIVANMISATQFLQSTEDIHMPDGIIADHVTYIALLQSYAYHGELIRSLRVFADMVAVLSRTSEGDNHSQPLTKTQTMKYMIPAYRAIFLGFVRHASSPEDEEYDRPSSDRLRSLRHRDAADGSAWTLGALQSLFQDFIRLPMDAPPSERFFFWVIRAFERASGRDIELLREVYRQLETRFGTSLGGRMEQVRRKLFEG